MGLWHLSYGGRRCLVGRKSPTQACHHRACASVRGPTFGPTVYLPESPPREVPFPARPNAVRVFLPIRSDWRDRKGFYRCYQHHRQVPRALRIFHHATSFSRLGTVPPSVATLAVGAGKCSLTTPRCSIASPKSASALPRRRRYSSNISLSKSGCSSKSNALMRWSARREPQV